MPEEVLTDNGKQFTGRFGQPRPAEVLFDRICRENGITAPADQAPVADHDREGGAVPPDPAPRAARRRTARSLDLAAAQAAIDAWRHDYNTDRPHQSLDMASPGRPVPPVAGDGLPAAAARWSRPGPAGHRAGHRAATITEPGPLRPPLQPSRTASARRLVGPPDAVELDRVVPPSGNLAVGRSAVLVRPAPGRPDGQLVDRLDHRPPQPRRRPGQDRALPAEHRRPRPAARRGRRPPGRATARAASRRPAGRAARRSRSTAPSTPSAWSPRRQPPSRSASRRRPPGHPPPRRAAAAPDRRRRTDAAPCPPRPGRTARTGSATPASPDHSQPHRPDRRGSSGRCPAAAASRSATNASRSA